MIASASRTFGILRRYPIPFLAGAGLAVGLLATYAGQNSSLGGWVWLGTLLLGGIPLVIATVRRLLRREFASDVIASFAIVGAIALDQAFAGVIIVLMQSGGEALEGYAFHRASSSLEELTRRAPRVAHRRRDGVVEEIPAESVAVGDVLTVRSGDLVPVDGVVLGLPALLDESAVTGEPLPRSRVSGEKVLSGSVGVGPAFDIRAVHVSRESQYARIVELVRSAQTGKPTIQRLADRYAVWFTPIALLVALGGAILTQNPRTALAVLVVATPCPLILATPIAVLGAINRAADQGVIAKSGAAIEEMGRTRVVLFDKTGTLTSGQPELERVVPFGSFSADQLLSMSAALEQYSSHPLAGSVLRGSRARTLTVPVAVRVNEFPGSGIEGHIDGKDVLVGSGRICESRAGASLTPHVDRLRKTIDLRGRVVSFVLIDGAPPGAIVFADRMRPEVPAVVRRLRSLGVLRVGMLTGDNGANAAEIAKATGIEWVEADLTPEQKVERVGEARRRYGSTLMVGDGINDAAALATASVGVAMGAHGAGISAEAADVVLLVDDVGRVADGVALGQRMLAIAQQGIRFGLGASFVLMAIAFVGWIAPAPGAVLQEAIDVAVIVNALRVR